MDEKNEIYTLSKATQSTVWEGIEIPPPLMLSDTATAPGSTFVASYIQNLLDDYFITKLVWNNFLDLRLNMVNKREFIATMVGFYCVYKAGCESSVRYLADTHLQDGVDILPIIYSYLCQEKLVI
tara:strand:+ start:1862 stop:2236 length:375 start_codon:yes stop_codon:yes gene_type:complete